MKVEGEMFASFGLVQGMGGSFADYRPAQGQVRSWNRWDTVDAKGGQA